MKQKNEKKAEKKTEKKTENPIVLIKRYVCGMETFQPDTLLQNGCHEKITLPVNVLLIEHRKLGHILINTGCSARLRRNPLRYSRYHAAHCLQFGSGDSIIEQLGTEGLDPLCIKKVLLSHYAPECCGALPLLPRYELISTAQVLSRLSGITDQKNIIRSTLPAADVKRRAMGLYEGKTVLSDYFRFIYDALGDGSVLSVDLSGHTEAMAGFYLPQNKLFFAADAALDERMLDDAAVPQKKLLALQSEPDDYLSVLSVLRQFHREHPEISIVFLHSQNCL